MVLDTLTAGDRVNLLELYARSAMLLDLGRCEDWLDLFEPRAVIRVDSQSGCQFAGRAELFDLARNVVDGRLNLALSRTTGPVPCRHILSNVCLFSDGYRLARGYAHLSITGGSDVEALRWFSAGVYADRVRRDTSGCWRFESRIFSPAFSAQERESVGERSRMKSMISTGAR
jgi:SnoaL-like domain